MMAIKLFLVSTIALLFGLSSFVWAQVDTDGDGIADEIDTNPNTISLNFSDVALGGNTTGRIDSLWVGFELPLNGSATDHTNPDSGVVITISDEPVSSVSVRACDDASRLFLDAGDEVVVTCGSVTIDVISGTAAITFFGDDGTTATVDLNAGNSLTFEPTTVTLVAPSTNDQNVEVLIGGTLVTLTPGAALVEGGEKGLLADIDIKPDSDPNCINLDSEGVVAVAILGRAMLDITEISQETLEFAGIKANKKGKSSKIGAFEDANDDGFIDLVLQFSIKDLELTVEDTEGILTGQLNDGTSLWGRDDLCVVPQDQASLQKSGQTSELNTLPETYSLAQNYPNPFNPETEVRFQLPKASEVTIKIYNTVGQEIRTLVQREYEAGFHSVRWNGKDSFGNPASSGIYFYRMSAGGFTQVRKMSLLR